MKRNFFTVFWAVCLILSINPSPAQATSAAAASACADADRVCMISELQATLPEITEKSWRDIAYRELIKLLAQEGRTTEAITLIDQITNPDTQALSIRGIGMAAAEINLTPQAMTELFTALRKRADAISQPAPREIAYTYISMSQVFARLDKDAKTTADAITNPALKHKALGEMAEIQAERNDGPAALQTLSEIEDAPYRNKASRTVALLLADRSLFKDAYLVTRGMTNPTLKAEALQYILTKQKPPASATHKGATP